MGIERKLLCILPLLFAISYAQLNAQGIFENPNEIFEKEQVLGPHELFGNPFGNPLDYKDQNLVDDVGTQPIIENGDAGDAASIIPLYGDGNASPEQKQIDWSNLQGSWELFSQNSGVSAMHSILLPKINKVLMYDATIWRISNVKLPQDHSCRVLNQTTGETDCWAHAVFFDINTSEITPLFVASDTWCSSGGVTVNGDFVSVGGFQLGANTIRHLNTCVGCQYREYPTALAAPRWYATQAQLPDGRFIVVGGRDSFSYEFIPQEGVSNSKPYYFDFLKQTFDPEENNLYPFVHLSTDGNLFIFANYRSVLLNPRTLKIVREFPILPGGHRNYPASGMSVLLPIKLYADLNAKQLIPAEVLICGGSAHADSYSKADKGFFYTALQDCGRIRITDNRPVWKRELMPTPRIMGDMMILPTGDVLMLNGAHRGASGWGFAREPNFTPVLYNHRAKRGHRMRELTPSAIPRMYHSSSTVLPDGKVLVAGSNTNNGYIYDAMFPTELRVEKFSPPYLDPSLAAIRPVILSEIQQIKYAQQFDILISDNGQETKKDNIKVTLYAPAFTTHGVSMNQRLVILGIPNVNKQEGQGYLIRAVAPHSGAIAPPGYYLMFVVREEVPSVGQWVQVTY